MEGTQEGEDGGSRGRKGGSCQGGNTGEGRMEVAGEKKRRIMSVGECRGGDDKGRKGEKEEDHVREGTHGRDHVGKRAQGDGWRLQGKKRCSLEGRR